MTPLLSTLLLLVGLAWGADVLTQPLPDAHPLWLARQEGLYLSGLMSIALMSLGMLLATRGILSGLAYVQTLTHITDAAEMARRIAAYGESQGWLVAEDEAGQILGYAYASPHRTREAYASSVDVAIYVADHAQGQGLGRAWMQRLRECAIHAAAAQVWLEVRRSNAPALKLYERTGFAHQGVRKGYYAEVNEDALVMWAHDVDAPAYGQRLAAIEATLPDRTKVEKRMGGGEEEMVRGEHVADDVRPPITYGCPPRRRGYRPRRCRQNCRCPRRHPAPAGPGHRGRDL